ncbi:MAG: tetratricopeptide repeat protein [Variovorax sp.]|nr:MAG: tetratricopeptide repeat protein [Variovorax sp.]
MNTLHRFGACAAYAILATLPLPPALAADTDSTPPALRLAAARSQIAAKNWPRAIAELKRVNDPGNADWNNLMGYSVRKGKTPDLAAAERYYNEALRIDPNHRGALEYSGELYLMLGNLPKAEERQAALARLCTVPCEELDDLNKAIEKYKGAGNKYVADE